MKRVLAAIVLSAALLSGCGKISDVRRRLVVHSIGIDPSDDGGYTVSYQVFSGGGNSDSGPVDASESTVKTLVSGGKTLAEAEEGLRLKTGKEVFLGDVELIVISDSLKDEGLGEFLQYFRKSDVYLGVNAVYCRGSASKVIGTKLEQGEAASILLREVVERAVEESRASSSRIIEISNAVSAPSEAIAIPLLEVKRGEDSGEDSTVSNLSVGITGGIVVSGVRPVKSADADACAGIRLLRGNAKRLSLSVNTSSGAASLCIDNIKIKRKLGFSDGSPLITVKISGRYKIMSAPENARESEIVSEAEKALLSLCEKARRLSAESGDDLFGIGRMIEKYAPSASKLYGGDFSEAVKSSVYDVFARLSEY